MRKLKIFLYVVIVTILLIIALLIWMQRDEPLNHTSQELFSLQSAYQADLKEHPYFLALGLDAKQEIDPMLLGRLRYHQYWAHYFIEPWSEWGENNRLELNIAKKFKGSSIDEDTQKLLQNLTKNRAKGVDLEILKSNQTQLNSSFEQNQYLIQRYVNFIQQKHYHDLSLPANSALLDYANMINLHYLYISKLAIDRNDDLLKSYIDRLMMMYAETTSLIYKMVLNRMIDSSVTLLHFLANEQNTPFNVMPMTDQQLSYKNVFAGELRYIETSLPSNNHDFGNGEVIDQSAFMRLLGKSNLFFLPNMTINQFANQYLPYIQLSESPYLKFKQNINSVAGLEQGQQEAFKLKNFMGNILANIGSPAFVDYMVKSRLLDNKIRVFNVLHSGEDWNITQLNLNEDGYEFYKTPHELCIRSPYRKKVEWNQDSCLSIQ
ncbi:hypothetical protein [Acinetobacter haemolyticus]|uniref:hypothetical protein n=1 Tax=Acinetobacter haemolyticus TaxID=29430 RepID=UPI0013735349|nr:hypothetical protein [Acinetobacter haemolyticus]NAS09798.1 hypothetical protein [Acinetobacter haemolyticus]